MEQRCSKCCLQVPQMIQACVSLGYSAQVDREELELQPIPNIEWCHRFPQGSNGSRFRLSKNFKERNRMPIMLLRDETKLSSKPSSIRRARAQVSATIFGLLGIGLTSRVLLPQVVEMSSLAPL